MRGSMLDAVVAAGQRMGREPVPAREVVRKDWRDAWRTEPRGFHGRWIGEGGHLHLHVFKGSEELGRVPHSEDVGDVHIGVQDILSRERQISGSHISVSGTARRVVEGAGTPNDQALRHLRNSFHSVGDSQEARGDISRRMHADEAKLEARRAALSLHPRHPLRPGLERLADGIRVPQSGRLVVEHGGRRADSSVVHFIDALSRAPYREPTVEQLNDRAIDRQFRRQPGDRETRVDPMESVALDHSTGTFRGGEGAGPIVTGSHLTATQNVTTAQGRILRGSKLVVRRSDAGVLNVTNESAGGVTHLLNAPQLEGAASNGGKFLYLPSGYEAYGLAPGAEVDTMAGRPSTRPGPDPRRAPAPGSVVQPHRVVNPLTRTR